MKHRSHEMPKIMLGGPRGPRGDNGLSAYGVWLRAGNTGTVDDFFSELSSNRPFIHLVKEDGIFSVYLQNEMSYGGEGVLIRQAGVYRAEYFCPGAREFYLELDGTEVPYSRFSGTESPWGVAMIPIPVREGPVRIQLKEVSEFETVRGVLSMMRIGPVVALPERW